MNAIGENDKSETQCCCSASRPFNRDFQIHENSSLPAPRLEDLREVEISDASEIRALIGENPPHSCESSFANIYMWGGAYKTKILRWRGRIVLYNSVDGLLRYPIGKALPPDELSELVDAFAKASLIAVPYIYDMPPDYLSIFPDAQSRFRFVPDAADFDYLYSIPHLIGLNGVRLRKKRNHIKHFLSGNPGARVEPVSGENLGRVRSFMLEIDERRGFLAEMSAIERGIENFEALSLKGILLYAESGDIAGAAVFSDLGSGAWTVHFEKSVHEIEGAAQFLVKEEADAIARLGGSVMNREQDLGDANLRHAKESLDPFAMYKRMRAYFNL